MSFCDPMDCSPPDSSVHGDSPGKNTEVSCHALLQGIFPTQGSNSCLLCVLHWPAGSLPLVLPRKLSGVQIFIALLFSRPVVSDSFRPYGLQHARSPCPSPSLESLPKFMFIILVMPSSHLILWRPLFLSSIFPGISLNSLVYFILE